MYLRKSYDIHEKSRFFPQNLHKKHENIVYHRVHSKKSEEESRRENDRRTREKTRSLRLNAALFPLFIMVPILYPQPPDNCATSREIHESPTTPSSARASNRDLVQTDGVSEFQRWSRPGTRSQASYEKPHTLGLPANCLAIDSTIEPSTRPGPNIKSNMSVYRSPCLVTCKQTIKLIISLATTNMIFFWRWGLWPRNGRWPTRHHFTWRAGGTPVWALGLRLKIFSQICSSDVTMCVSRHNKNCR